jgi:hypothetical protein
MRIFYICSYGGCASKMLCRFLSKFYIVYHIHSRYPPKKLTAIRKTKIHKKMEWFNYQKVLGKKLKDLVTVIYIYRKPSTSLLSTEGWGRCHYSNIGLNIHNKTIQKFFSKKEQVRFNYSKHPKDLFGLENFFKNYVIKKNHVNYDIICIKYEELWDNLDQIFSHLKIPDQIKEQFPKKYEKTLTPVQEETKQNLKKKYERLETMMDTLPALYVNERFVKPVSKQIYS